MNEPKLKYIDLIEGVKNELTLFDVNLVNIEFYSLHLNIKDDQGNAVKNAKVTVKSSVAKTYGYSDTFGAVKMNHYIGTDNYLIVESFGCSAYERYMTTGETSNSNLTLNVTLERRLTSILLSNKLEISEDVVWLVPTGDVLSTGIFGSVNKFSQGSYSTWQVQVIGEKVLPSNFRIEYVIGQGFSGETNKSIQLGVSINNEYPKTLKFGVVVHTQYTINKAYDGGYEAIPGYTHTAIIGDTISIERKNTILSARFKRDSIWYDIWTWDIPSTIDLYPLIMFGSDNQVINSSKIIR